MSTVAALFDDLARLRRGGGVRSPRSGAEVGPRLRDLCGIETQDGPASVRSKLQAGLNALLSDLSPDEQLVASAALGLHPDATGVLARRIEWLARVLDRSERTTMRRIDATLWLLADAAMSRRPTIHSPQTSGVGWVTQQLRTLVRLDKSAADVMQERRIVATRDDVETINEVVGLPRQTGTVVMEILFGGWLRSVERDAMRVRYEIAVPSALMRGESHSYGVQFRFPDDQPPASHYVVQPHVQMREFTLRVRFDPSRLPKRVWRIEEASQREIANPQVAGTLVAPDRAGEVMAEFHDLGPAMAYGVALDWDGDAWAGAEPEGAEQAAPSPAAGARL